MTTVLENLTRAATLTPDSYDADARTIEALISSFADVARRDQRGDYIERLDATGLDTSQLIGAPLLDGHRSSSGRDVVGVVSAFRMEAGSLIATIQLSRASDALPIVDRILERSLRGVSIGYRVSKWADSIDPATKSRIRTATSWTIFEASAVPIAADSQSKFRTGTPNMALDENNTRAEIRTICRSAGLTPEQADDMIDRDLSATEARAEAFDALQTRSAAQPKIKIVGSSEDPAVIGTRRADALHARITGKAPSDEAKPYVNESLRDMARACVEAAGTSTRMMDTDQLFRAAMHGTSDFPALLTSTGNRTLMDAYQVAQSPIRQLARQTTLADFRPASRLKLSDVGLLQELSESGEIQHTTRGEAVESYALKTYATQFAISRKALINDDLGAFRDWGMTAGRMAAETEANILVGLLLSNPVLGETSESMFSAAHGNVPVSGTILDVTNLSVARRAMRTQKGLDGKTPISATPRYLVVGPDLETFAEQLLSTIYAATVDTANPFTERLTLLVEPRITDGRWYVFADPATLPTIEYAYLSSAQGPQMASREGWDVLGVEFRIVLDFGAGAVDFRGAYFNGGI